MSDKVRHGLFATAALMLPVANAHAAVTISSAATSNMSCASGICTPTAKDAVLNASDLATMLASGNVQANTGSKKIAPKVEDIVVSASFNWASANSLTLDAWRSITFDQPVAANGTAPVSLVTNDGGSGGNLSFGTKGSLSFLGTTNGLSINGTAFTLENSVAALASAIAAKPSGNYALANSYDASVDGTYSNSPIATTLTGAVEGLGNTISNLSIVSDAKRQFYTGLFSFTAAGSAIESVRLTGVSIDAKRRGDDAGSLVAYNSGTLFDDHVAGTLSAKSVAIGGLAGVNSSTGTIVNSSANAKIKTPYLAGGLTAANAGTILQSSAAGTIDCGSCGGLVGNNDGGTIEASFATGSEKGSDDSIVGGLVGISQEGGQTSGLIGDSYATGNAMSGANAEAGGFIGENDATIENSFSTGAVAGGTGSFVGGFSGGFANPVFAECFWDITTSGSDEGTGGGNQDGITGLTTAQLQSGLPQGFDPTVWAENPKINGGLPYLINNPPPKK